MALPMTTTKDKIEFCKMLCSYLNEEARFIPSQTILSRFDVPMVHHNAARSLMHRLADSGVLERRGVGKYAWKLVSSDYDRDNPLSAYYRYNRNRQETGQQRSDDGEPAPKPGGQQPSNGAETAAGRAQASAIAELERQLKELKQKLAEMESQTPRELTIKQPDKPDVIIEGNVHPVFAQVMFHISCGDDVMLVGPKGCGKTYLAGDVARALGLGDPGILSLSGGVTESKLFGRNVPNITNGKNEFHAALFATMFEKGGLFLLDEVDAADPNVIISLNSTLANGWMALDRVKNPNAKRNEDFYCMAAANTWGAGADRQYVGRNQQDAAFVERFVQIAMDYDPAMELRLCPGADGFVTRMHLYRARITENRLERTLSTRFIRRAYNWLQHGKDESYCEEMLFAGWRADEIKKVKGA